MNFEKEFIKTLSGNFPEPENTKLIYYLLEKSVVDMRGMRIYLVKEAIRMEEKKQKYTSKMGMYNNVAELLGMNLYQVIYYSRQ